MQTGKEGLNHDKTKVETMLNLEWNTQFEPKKTGFDILFYFITLYCIVK